MSEYQKSMYMEIFKKLAKIPYFLLLDINEFI